MSRRAVSLYVATVDVLALVLLACAPTGGLRENAGTVLLVAVLGALVGSRPVRVPALRTYVTCSDAFALCAMVAIGPWAGALVAMGAVVGGSLAEKTRPSPIRFLFNLGAVAVAAVGAYWIFVRVGGVVGAAPVAVALPVILAGTGHYLLNTSLVAGVISIDRRQRFWVVWKNPALWTALTGFVGIAVALALVGLLQTLGPAGLVLGVAPAWLLATFVRANKERIEERDGRIESVVEHNAQLERMVQERTRELQDALSHVEAMNHELRASNERLEEASRIKSEFLANVSHELRTPLNAVIGFSDLLADPVRGPLNPEQRDFVSDIQESGEHLLHLINNILDLSKIEAGKLETDLRAASVPDLVREAAAMLRPAAGAKNQRVEVFCDSALSTARLDAGMFREVLANLLSNAVKFTPDGGRVDLEAMRDGGDLVVTVRDTGIGIAPTDQERIFEAFCQVDGSYSRSYQGTGLGLALVRRLIALHGGQVTVHSTLGEGSSFTCVLPACVVDSTHDPGGGLDRSSREEPPASRPVGERTILLVEDNPLNRKLARNALRYRGFRVLEAVTGEEALEVLGRARPELILMDLQLPGMDGFETTRHVKAEPMNAAIPVVALTAHVQSMDENRARAAGCVGIITKPIRLSQFADQIEAYLASAEAVA